MSLSRRSALAGLVFGLGALAATALPARAQQQMMIGSSVTGTITSGDPTLGDGSHYRLYTFNAAQGQTVQIDLMSAAFDAYLILRNQDGSEITHDDNGGGGLNARIVQTLPYTGQYVIVVNTRNSGQFGDYTVQLQAVSGQAAPPAPPAVSAAQLITLGATVTGTLTAGDPTLGDSSHYKLYTFNGTQGQAVQIDLMSSAFDAYLILRDQNGNEITHDDDGGAGLNSRIIQTLPYTGQYFVLANTANANEFGDYTLQLQAAQTQPVVTSIQPSVPVTQLPVVMAIGLNQQVQNTLIPGGATWNGKPIQLYTLDCPAGQRFQMDVNSTWDNYAVVFDPGGNDVAHDDDGGEGLNARVQYTCPVAGTYRLGVTTFSSTTTTGQYTMQVQTVGQVVPVQVPPAGQPTGLPQPSAGTQPGNVVPAPGQIAPIAVGQTMRGRLEPGDQLMGSDSTYADVWQFQGAAGQSVTVELQSDDFDTYLQLLDAGGRVLQWASGHPASTLTFRLPSAGMYQIVVNNNGHQRQTGTYVVSVH